MTIKVTSTKNDLADKYGSIAAKMSLWSGDPSDSGTECAGGSYSRQSLSWGSASGGTTSASEVTFNAPSGTWDYIALHDSGGTMMDSVSVTSTTLGAAGQVKVTASFTQS